MNYATIFLLGLGLSMDAFAVSVCKGLAMNQLKLKHMATVGAWFGGFQGLMPAIGFLLGVAFESIINSFDHFVGFGLLLIIGGNMIREALSGQEECADCSLACKTMFVMAVATSIDALAVGITLPTMGVVTLPQMLISVLIIGVTTFVLSMVGVKIGNIFGTKYKQKAEIAGGVILILLGLKILLEGLGVL